MLCNKDKKFVKDIIKKDTSGLHKAVAVYGKKSDERFPKLLYLNTLNKVNKIFDNNNYFPDITAEYFNNASMSSKHFYYFSGATGGTLYGITFDIANLSNFYGSMSVGFYKKQSDSYDYSISITPGFGSNGIDKFTTSINGKANESVISVTIDISNKADKFYVQIGTYRNNLNSEYELGECVYINFLQNNEQIYIQKIEDSQFSNFFFKLIPYDDYFIYLSNDDNEDNSIGIISDKRLININ